ncbi:ComF family protein [Anaerosacchariphilus polymeriproducens]|uniref:ComF family protein n=1 Tax=Anaerosacchariphilus polymeriproducens TaxID=1812858 RepID=A0A371AR68_9FIRM|nr:ComF family protein [Anaerosacchariphilus polymeriproducens]
MCKECEKKLEYIKEPRCKKCGKAIDNDIKEYCFECEMKEHDFTQGRGVFVYQEEMKQSIYRFKYRNKREYADFYVEKIAEEYREWIFSCRPQVLIPVPLYKFKKRQRGFNQAEILADKLGKVLNIPVESNLVIRCKKTIPQKELSEKERKNNMKNAFKITQSAVKLKRVMLVDDIYTTGSTIDEVAKILKKSGVDEVYFIVVCVGRGY